MRPLHLFFLLLFATFARASETRVLFLGDSITHDGRWAAWVESALRHDPGYADAEILNLGLPSETVSCLSEPNHAAGAFPRPCLHERLGRILERCPPTLVIACYGMNDGIYLPADEARMDAYRKGMTRLKEEVETSGSRIVFVTPPLHDADKPSSDPARYDAVLDGYTAWLTGNRAKGWLVVDIRDALRKSIAQAKAAGTDFVYAADGIHPGAEGHRFIAEAVCKGLWPILGATEAPRFDGPEAYAMLSGRANLLRDAWLTETKFIRPGMPEGKPVAVADKEARILLGDYQLVSGAKLSEWSGYQRLDFTVDGRAALLVRPEQAAEGQPWIWRTEFFGHEPQADIGLLEKGFHVAYIDLQDMYGSPVSMIHMGAFHDYLTIRGLALKPVLEGFSRGGLFAFNWAARCPDYVAGLYVDAPVCDFKSWPGGKGAGPGAAGDWEKCLKAYGMTEAEALAYKGNPVDNLEPLAKAGIPIFAVIGDADEAVPVQENIDVIEKRYKELGGKIEVIRKPGGKHHPHSLPDPKPIVDFVVKAAK